MDFCMNSLEEDFSSTHYNYLQDESFVALLNAPTEPEMEPMACSSDSEEEEVVESKKSKKRNWVKTCSTDSEENDAVYSKKSRREWWDRVNHPSYPDSDFRKDFRMSKSTFDLICESLASAIAKEDAIPVRQRVAVCVWYLATGEAFQLISKRFGLEKFTCHKLILEVCSAIYKVFMGKLLDWPNAAKSEEISRKFEAAFGLPNVIGAIYTTHVPIVAPKANAMTYVNRRQTERHQKASYSVTVQGVVDANGMFTDVCIGWPGSLSDQKILENSALFRKGCKGALSGSWIVGGASYPLTDWMLVPYAHQNITWPLQAFNEKVSGIREVARKAFEKMKRRWGCLQKKNDMKNDDLLVVLGACCILHNICEMRGEELLDFDGVGFHLVDDEMVAESPVLSIGAMEMRDKITSFVAWSCC